MVDCMQNRPNHIVSASCTAILPVCKMQNVFRFEAHVERDRYVERDTCRERWICRETGP